MCVCVCVTGAGVRGDDDDAVLRSRKLTGRFGDEVLLGARQTCKDVSAVSTHANKATGGGAGPQLSHAHCSVYQRTLRRKAGLTGEPVQNGTLVGTLALGLGGQEDGKLHLTPELRTTHTHTHTVTVITSQVCVCVCVCNSGLTCRVRRPSGSLLHTCWKTPV